MGLQSIENDVLSQNSMKINAILITILILGVFTRSYQLLERFNYAHDNDLASWIIKDIVIDKHVRLIGQLTSSPGVFIGPLWYYLQIPFYLLGHMDPGYVPFLSVGVGLVAIISIYYVMAKIYGQKAGEFAALIYAISQYISNTERDVVPTTPVFLWSIWFLYGINLLVKGNRRGLVVVAILWAMIWHINLALIFSVPLVVGVLIFRWWKFSVRDFVLPIVILVVLSLPLVAFEFRHQFSQTRALLETGSQSGRSLEIVGQKASKVVFFTTVNANRLFWTKPSQLSWAVVPLVLLLGGVYLVKQGVISKDQAIVYISWWGTYLVMFSLNPLNLSEYYLNGFTILWVVLAALLLTRIFNKWPVVAIAIAIVFIAHNLLLAINVNVDESGYLQKKALVAFIANDSRSHGYPCLAVSYMTDPGRDLGYRYWYWLSNLHVNTPRSGSPVYTVVFPHTRAGRLDKTFGSLGLVYPDYSRYTKDQVEKSCQGENENLTGSMFGFTK